MMCELILKNLTQKFCLTEKYFKDTEGKTPQGAFGYYEYMAQEYLKLINFDNLFNGTVCSYINFCCSIRLRPKGKRYYFSIIFDRTGSLAGIKLELPKPTTKEAKERRKILMQAAKDITGYFIAVMIHHGYIQKEV